MIRRLGLLVVIAAVFLFGTVAPSAVAAAEGIEITRSLYSGLFPTTLSFNLSARSDAEIIDARLHYQVHRQSFVEVENEAFVPITPAKEIDISYSLDLRRAGGLPPGTTVDYWWTLKDSAGSVTTSEISTLKFTDSRYQWQTLQQGMVSLFWYTGSSTFADELMATAQGALIKLEQDTGASLTEPVEIYIYDSAQALQGSMVFPQEWTGGVAFTDFNTIAIGIEPSNINWGKRAIVHELTHLVTGQMTDNPYGGIPTWLNEGLSMYAEGPADAIYLVFLNQAIDQKSLISINSLSSPFSAFADISSLSYAESRHIVSYLIEKYGQDKMLRLLDTFAGGATTDEALSAVYGFDMDGLNTEWQAFIYDSAPTYVQSGVTWTPWLVILIVLVVGAAVVAAVWLFYPSAIAAAGAGRKND